jgi:hypothetical protein
MRLLGHLDIKHLLVRLVVRNRNKSTTSAVRRLPRVFPLTMAGQMFLEPARLILVIARKDRVRGGGPGHV